MTLRELWVEYNRVKNEEYEPTFVLLMQKKHEFQAKKRDIDWADIEKLSPEIAELHNKWLEIRRREIDLYSEIKQTLQNRVYDLGDSKFLIYDSQSEVEERDAYKD